jgi:hypothetical protein
LIHAGIPADISRRTGLVQARINTRTCASYVTSSPGLVDAGVPADISRRSRLVHAGINARTRAADVSGGSRLV